MVGDAIANIEAQDVARKDNVDAAYRQRDAQLSQQQMSLEQQRAANISQVAGGVSNALASGAMYFANAKSSVSKAGQGSPGGGGVNPPVKTDQLQKMGIDSNDKWIKKNQDKIFDYNNNWNQLQGVMGSYFS